VKGYRRTLLWFVGSLLAAAFLNACGGGASDSSQRPVARHSLGIPLFKGVKSGELEVALTSYGGKGHDNLLVSLVGFFVGASGGAVPEVDFGAQATGGWRGEPVDFETALIATDDRAVLTYDGDTFETDPHTFKMLQASFGEALGSRSSADFAACLEAVGDIDLKRLAATPTNPVHSTARDGTELSTISAQLKIHNLIEALHQVQSDPGCNAQLRAAGSIENLLAGVEIELERAKRADVKLSLDKNGILRELRIHQPIASPGEGATDAEFVFRLDSVNEVAELPPCHGERALDALFEKLGFNPLEQIERGDAEGLIGLLKGIFGQSGQEGRA